MNRGVDIVLVRRIADILHDVDLAAVGPSGTWIVRAEHPKCRPDPLPLWDLDTCLDATVRPLGFALRLDTSGCVVVAPLRLLSGRYDEIAVAVHGRVVGRIRVVLEFAIAPTIATRIERPLS